ncbi:hypothetical protein [Marisediminicola sp. LYQ85]|uniref:hypothetical protein n=1 Tax=Marisediminicola sp. LYQ85 TaxID=3391062 RepID=UPI0039834CA1
MKRAAAAFIAVGLGLTLAGCGDSAEERFENAFTRCMSIVQPGDSDFIVDRMTDHCIDKAIEVSTR